MVTLWVGESGILVALTMIAAAIILRSSSLIRRWPEITVCPLDYPFNYPGKTCDVRLWHFSDIPPALTNVRYRGKANMTRTGRYVG